MKQTQMQKNAIDFKLKKKGEEEIETAWHPFNRWNNGKWECELTRARASTNHTLSVSSISFFLYFTASNSITSLSSWSQWTLVTIFHHCITLNCKLISGYWIMWSFECMNDNNHAAYRRTHYIATEGAARKSMQKSSATQWNGSKEKKKRKNTTKPVAVYETGNLCMY